MLTHYSHFRTRPEAFGENGMAATSQPLATLAALDILRSGGNALDAAIAANAVQGLTEPTGCGIGGDLFALVWEPQEKRLHGLNASGRSPRAVSLDELKARSENERIPRLGPLAVTVPGCVDGWNELHTRFGRARWADLFAPAIELAREGFAVTENIAESWRGALLGNIAHQPGFLETFSHGGNAPQKGEIWRNPALAYTLEAIANEGGAEFYQGVIAQKSVAWLQQHGGLLTAADFSAHYSTWAEPVSTLYRGYDVWELPPNGQGIAALQMLNILEAYDLRGMGFGSVDYMHHFIEAKKLAFEDRAKFYADPDFASVPVKGLISKEYAATRRSLLDSKRAAANYPWGEPPQSPDTIYLCTADGDGMMVSLIQSNYAGFGSGVCVPELGFGFQNRGADFSLDPAHANCYAPGKRPFHTIIPAFVTQNGEPCLAFGVMGADMQPQGHVQILCNLIDFGMSLQTAGDAPRIHHSGSSSPTGDEMKSGGEVEIETGFAPEVMEQLGAMGHTVTRHDAGNYGGYQAIWRDAASGVYSGATERRKDGIALGF